MQITNETNLRSMKTRKFGKLVGKGCSHGIVYVDVASTVRAERDKKQNERQLLIPISIHGTYLQKVIVMLAGCLGTARNVAGSSENEKQTEHT